MQGHGAAGNTEQNSFTPPIALPTHLLCQWALPSNALPADIVGWEETVNSQEPGSSPCVHTPSYISPSYCMDQVCQRKEVVDREFLGHATMADGKVEV